MPSTKCCIKLARLDFALKIVNCKLIESQNPSLNTAEGLLAAKHLRTQDLLIELGQQD
ncbi:hypothetical protein PL11201_530198 [Planktothrix sp. PCC 11201]|nr:hypothetical protein PL11201_530198 [Planktothrix sp. PCC 11201]